MFFPQLGAHLSAVRKKQYLTKLERIFGKWPFLLQKWGNKGQLAYLTKAIFHDTLQPGRKSLCGARAAFGDDASNL